MTNNSLLADKPPAKIKKNEPFEATVLNVIIRDFIQLTERLSTASLANLMRDYYEKVCFQVAQQQGVLTSISNHSMVVTFFDVEDEDTHARRALRCALAIAMIAYQTRFWIRQKFPEQGLDKFGVGIGIHTGELVLVELGLAPHGQLVASGYAVSIASLLSVKSKELDWNVVCSEQALRAAGQGVQAKRHATIGAEWLDRPVRAVEVAVVRGVDEGEGEFAEGQQFGDTRTLDLGTGGRISAFARARQSGVRPEALPVIPGYRCVQTIGTGGMSRVFLVERKRDGAQLALKFADGSVSEDSDVLYRFVEEYGLLEQIHHPNVLEIYEQGVTDDALFIVMEYLPGGTLRQRIPPQGMKFERAWKILHEMMLALAEIHRKGIIHRDIKPDNIMLRTDGTAVLGDFGVARHIYKGRERGLDIIGTPYFMSPEQALGEAEDERTDIYSMGAVFFNMLTGEKPYQGDTLEEIVRQHLQEPVPQLPAQYRHLQFLLERMMAKDVELRCSADELLRMMFELGDATAR